MDTHDKVGDRRNPVSNAIGEHPVGTTAGAVAGGAAAGAAAGTVAGPVGTAAGAVAGAVAGGVAGNRIAEMTDDDREKFWREKFARRPYVEKGASFDDYAPAYRYGVEAVRRHERRKFEEVEPQLREEWTRERGASRLDWDRAKHPVRDAWNWVTTDIDHD